MNDRKIVLSIKFTILTVLIFLFGCSSPLLETIKEEVKIVTTPPSIESLYPLPDSAGISVDGDILVIFSKNISQSSVTSGTFTVTDEYGGQTTGRFDVSSDTVTFTPNNLYYNTLYTATATAGILDVNGNQFTSDYTWHFTTQAAPESIKPDFQGFQINNGLSATRNTGVELGFIATDYLGGTAGLEVRYKLNEVSDWSEWTSMESGFINISDDLIVTLGEGENQTFVFEAEVRDANKVVSTLKQAQITYKTTNPAIDEENSIPIPGSVTQIGNLSYIKLAFDSEMDPGTVTNETVYISKGTTKISTHVYDFSADRKEITYTVFEENGEPYELEQNTDYSVFISRLVADIAGNDFDSDFSYSFSTGSALDNAAPEGVVALDRMSPEINATNGTIFDLEITAEDEYNNVRAVKIWGDNANIANLPLFESDASWILYSEIDSDGADNIPGNADDENYMSYFGKTGFNWQVPGTDGDYYIYYKFIDYANNESQTPGIMKLSRDGTPPELNGLQIDSGTGFTNNGEGIINIILDAEDLHSGLEGMWVTSEPRLTANVPGSDSGIWMDWSTLVTSYPLPVAADSEEGKYYIYGEVRDYVGNLSTPGYTSVILDYTEPEVDFTGIDILNVNGLTRQNVNISDPDPGAGAHQVPSDIASYEWEQVSGPGTLEFYSDSGGISADSTVEFPYIKASASDGSQDGNYEIKVTATDHAGNSSYNIIDFQWDTVDPGNIGTISAFNSDGTSLTTSANGSMVYTSSAQPYATWTEITGADFYTIIPYGDDSLEPNHIPVDDYGDPGWHPHWDDDEVDWDNPATYENKNYIRKDNPIVSAPAPDVPGDNDGPVYLYVAAWDIAGNRSNRISDQLVKFHIDTLPPLINNLQPLPVSRSALLIEYDGTDGEVYDQGTRASGLNTTSYRWEQISGAGTLTIDDETTLTPTVYAAANGFEDGDYELKLTVSDNAGNSYEHIVGFFWDTTAPSDPTVTGISHTPSVIPTWSWFGNGGGNGYYRYRMERIPVENAYNTPDVEASGDNPNRGDPTGPAEEVSLTGSDAASPYWVTDSTDISYQHSGSGDYKYTLFVQERDVAGNWSDSNSYQIWIDTNYTSEPAVTRDGAYLRNGDEGDRTVVWNWTTGLGEPAIESYRYRLLNSATTPVIDWTTLADDIRTVEIDFSPAGEDLPDGVYTLVVQEFNVSNGRSLVDKEAHSDVQIDATAPNAPIINKTYTTGSETFGDDTDYYLTNDTTPYFRWSTGGGGSGSYRWSFNGSSWTYTNSIYVTTSNSEGIYTFHLQERDTAGNWSDSELYYLEIDRTAPTLNSILLSNRSLNAYNSTAYTVETSVDIDIDGSGVNNRTYTGNDIEIMRFWNSGGTKYPYPYDPQLLNWFFTTGGTSGADGSKTVYCELIDYAGNISVSRVDSITKDMVSPSVSSFSINGGETTSASAAVTLDSTLPADTFAMRISDDGGATWSIWYSDSTTKAWTLNTHFDGDTYGAKKVMVQFTDAAGYYCHNTVSGLAGHATNVQDSIFYGTPDLRFSDKGQFNDGTIESWYNSFEDDGDSQNRYYIYYSTSPTGTKSYKGYTYDDEYFGDNGENGEVIYSGNNTYAKGTLYYLFLRVYNSDIGWSNYSSYTLGFSSDVTVVYDDLSSEDAALASNIRSRLTYHFENNYTQVVGTFPQYTVTLLPESLIDNSYVAGETTIYGDPIILTPGTGSTSGQPAGWYSTIQNRMHNIAAGGKGILGMHYQGSRFMHYANYYISNSSWADAGSSDTGPSDLVYQKAYDKGSSLYAKTATYSYVYDYSWFFGYHRPGYGIYYDDYWNNYRYTQTSARLFSTSTEKYSIYNINSSGSNSTAGNPGGTRYQAFDNEYTDHYTVARQGRFMFWGYKNVPTYSYFTSYPIFINTVGILHNYY